MPQALEEKGSLILSWSGNDAYSFGKVRVDRSARAIVVTKENWVRFAKSFSHSKVVLLNFARFAPSERHLESELPVLDLTVELSNVVLLL